MITHHFTRLESMRSFATLALTFRRVMWARSGDNPFCRHMEWPPEQNLPHSGRSSWTSSALGASISLVMLNMKETDKAEAI